MEFRVKCKSPLDNSFQQAQRSKRERGSVAEHYADVQFVTAMPTLLAIMCSVLLAGIVMAFFLQHSLFSRLSVEHPTVSACLNESSAGIMAFPRYLWKRQYLGLGDEAFTRRADTLRRFWKACFLFFLLFVAILLGAIALKK